MPVKDYNADPDLNTQISGINIAEGCAPSGINNAIRQLMADVKTEKEARDAAQSTRDSQQDAAISAAQTSANERISTLDSTLRALIAQEVARCLLSSGDTMEGRLNFERGQLFGYSGDCAGIELCGNKENPESGARFSARAPDATNGPNCAVMVAQDDKSASFFTLWPDGRVTQDSKDVDFFPITSIGTNHIRFSNGFQICWGAGFMYSTGTTVTFQKAFLDAKSYVVLTVTTWGERAPSAGTPSHGIGSKRASSFMIRPANDSYFEWTAIGRWM